MKRNRTTITLAALLILLPAVVQATTQSSPNYSINAGRIVSGGTASADAAGMSKSGIAIGQAVFIPGGKASSPGFSSGTVALAAIASSPLVISTLPNGANTATSPLTISGTVPTNPLPQSLTINGAPVAINSDGSFSAGIPLQQGSNTITVSATDQNGVASTQSRAITYTPTAAPLSITSIADNSGVSLSQSSVIIGGTVGPNATGVAISLNGGTPQVVTPVNGAFSVSSGTLASGLNTIVITATTASGATSSRALTVWRSDAGSELAHTGDINGDGVVNIVDALLALKNGIGLVKLTGSEVSRGDVAPLVKGVAVGDGRIDIQDTILILRKAVGMSW
jgi:hypothetical protein